MDTIREGYFLSHPRVVEIMAREAPGAILELDEWGCEFARTEDGRPDQRFFGAHSYRRTCYAGDFTGRAMLRALHARARAIGVPDVIEDTYVAKLLCADGCCFGALAFDIHSGERTVLLADAVILATGGHTRLWRRSSSRRDENFGEGFGLALDVGCAVMDMELVQFHPTGMVFPEEAAGTLVTEAVRGEGGRLFNANGERYMERYDPERLELSSRDRVALANYTEIAQGRGTAHGGVHLDISHIGKDAILEKLPRMYRQFIEYQMLDIAKQPMEVAPTAHYTMGGIVVDPETHATEVHGLVRRRRGHRRTARRQPSRRQLARGDRDRRTPSRRGRRALRGRGRSDRPVATGDPRGPRRARCARPSGGRARPAACSGSCAT